MTERENNRQKRPGKSYNEQQNMAEFAQEATTLRSGKANKYPPSVNNINKKLTD